MKINGYILLGYATADSNGASVTSTSLGNGNYSLTAKAADDAGNISEPSSALSISVNTGNFEWTRLLGSAGDDQCNELTIGSDSSIE